MAISWHEQLSKVRQKVIEAEKRRELERKLRIQRTKEGLAKQLDREPPQVLERQLRDLEGAFHVGVRQLFPIDSMEAAFERLQEIGDKVAFYLNNLENFPDVFSEGHKQALLGLKVKLDKLQSEVTKQIEEWRAVRLVMEGTEFRGKQENDEPYLLHIAKTFHKRAHGIELNLPRNFFSKKSEGFFVATYQNIPYAYVELGDEPGVFTFAVGEVRGANFIKLVRGFLHKFCTDGPTGQKFDEVRIRVTSREEVKFYTNLGFLRRETRGMSDWVYARPAD